MYKTNTAVTGFGIGHFINATTGAEVTTGTPVCKRVLDGTAGTLTYAASYNATAGVWEIDLAAADMNGTNIILTFTLTDCLPISYTISTVTKLVSELNDFNNATETVNLSAAYDPAKTAAQAGDAMTLVDNAITAAKIAASALNDKGNWNTTTPPTTAQIKTALEAVGSYLDLIKAKADNAATVAELTALRGADNDTLKTLSDQVDGVTGGTINNITNESTTITRC